MFRSTRSYITALRASRRFGAASRLRASGRKAEALSAGLEALAALAQPHVIRSNPAEASALLSATVLVEGLASELKQPGASLHDINESLSCVRALGRESYAEFASFLEWRVRERGAGAV
jgi:hypothetical protein